MSANLDKQFGRRGALLGIGLAAAGAATGIHREATADEEPAPPTPEPAIDPSESPNTLSAHELRPASEAVRALFGEHLPGTALESHWRVEALYDLRGGAIPVVLATNDGTRFAVEVFRTSESERPIATAGPLALYLVNRGDGSSSTDEAAGLGVMALGRVLTARIAAGATVPASLVTLAGRRREHPTGVFHVPLA